MVTVEVMGLTYTVDTQFRFTGSGPSSEALLNRLLAVGTPPTLGYFPSAADEAVATIRALGIEVKVIKAEKSVVDKRLIY